MPAPREPQVQTVSDQVDQVQTENPAVSDQVELVSDQINLWAYLKNIYQPADKRRTFIKTRCGEDIVVTRADAKTVFDQVRELPLVGDGMAASFRQSVKRLGTHAP